MNITDLKIGQKINLGFGLAIILMIALSVVSYVGLSTLTVMQDAGADRAKDAEFLTGASQSQPPSVSSMGSGGSLAGSIRHQRSSGRRVST